MGTNLKWAKALVFSLAIVAVSAFAAPAVKEDAKGITIWGSFEGGYKQGWHSATTTSYNGFQVDEINLNLKARVGEKTSFHFDNSFAYMPSAGGLTDLLSATNFWSRYAIAAGMMNTRAAYLDHKCAEGWHTWIGLFKTPFGLETQWSTYDMPTYHHSRFYGMMAATTGNENSLNAYHDLGLKFAISEMIPGTLEVALLDGRNATNAARELSLTQALRWSYEWKSGDSSLTPVVSAFFGRWNGGPKDIGLNAGATWKSGTWWVNGEFNWFQMGRQASNFTTNDTTMNVYVEPGFDLGMANVSVKAEWLSSAVNNAAAVTDFNVGAAISKSWDNYRVRLAYNHVGLSGNLPAAATTHTNDVRLLFGTKF